MTRKAIGAGFGRTGTGSRREALELLGLGPTHHMREPIADPERKAAEGPEGWTRADWDRLLGGGLRGQYPPRDGRGAPVPDAPCPRVEAAARFNAEARGENERGALKQR